MNIDFFNKSRLSKIDFVEYRVNPQKKISFAIKRDDLIDCYISGNKWRKLKHNMQFALNSKYQGIATFGGAFSNHIAASARAAQQLGLDSIGFIRTHQIDDKNPTLTLAQEHGMSLKALNRLNYARRNEIQFLQELQDEFPNYFFIPEGGSNELADGGLQELAQECSNHIENNDITAICVPIGSGGTALGLAKHLPLQKLIGIAAVNDDSVLDVVRSCMSPESFIHTNALFGGYAKVNKELEAFCLDFFQQTGVAIEPVYSGKMFYALCHQRQDLGLSDQDIVLAIHTGGLQGLKGMIYRNVLDAKTWIPVLDSYYKNSFN